MEGVQRIILALSETDDSEAAPNHLHDVVCRDHVCRQVYCWAFRYF